jgi:hypothetical protein
VSGGAARAGGAASLAALAAGDGADALPEGEPPAPGVSRGVAAGEDAGEARRGPGRPRKAAPDDDDDLF